MSRGILVNSSHTQVSKGQLPRVRRLKRFRKNLTVPADAVDLPVGRYQVRRSGSPNNDMLHISPGEIPVCLESQSANSGGQRRRRGRAGVAVGALVMEISRDNLTRKSLNWSKNPRQSPFTHKSVKKGTERWRSTGTFKTPIKHQTISCNFRIQEVFPSLLLCDRGIDNRRPSTSTVPVFH